MLWMHSSWPCRDRCQTLCSNVRAAAVCCRVTLCDKGQTAALALAVDRHGYALNATLLIQNRALPAVSILFFDQYIMQLACSATLHKLGRAQAHLWHPILTPLQQIQYLPYLVNPPINVVKAGSVLEQLLKL